DVGGNPLADGRLVQRVHEQGQVAVNVGIDQPRTDGPVGGVDHRPGRGPGQPADRRDTVAADADVAAKPGVAGAVDDPAGGNQHVEGIPDTDRHDATLPP